MKKLEPNLLFFGCVFVLFFSFSKCFGQQEDEIYQYYNTIVGIENTGLFNGIEYIDNKAVLNDHNKFFIPASSFTKGWIVYDNQYYPNIKMKYNLVDDRVLVELGDDNRQSTFQLITAKIKEFGLAGHIFFRLKGNGGVPEGFYEKIYSDGTRFIYKKLRKKEFRRMDKQYLYYEYFQDKPSYFYVNANDEAFSLNSANDFIKIFPEKKKSIRKFYREQKILYKQNLDKFNQMLMTTIVSN